MLSVKTIPEQWVVNEKRLCTSCHSNLCADTGPPSATIFVNNEQHYKNTKQSDELAHNLMKLQIPVKLERQDRRDKLDVSQYPTFYDGYNVLEHMLRIQRVDNDNVIGLFANRPIWEGKVIATFSGAAMPFDKWYKQYGDDLLHRRYTYVKEEFHQIIAMDATEPKPAYGFGRFINHSTNHANVRCISVVAGKKYGELEPATDENRATLTVRLVFYTIVDIEAGDEILVNFSETSNQSHADDPWMHL